MDGRRSKEIMDSVKRIEFLNTAYEGRILEYLIDGVIEKCCLERIPEADLPVILDMFDNMVGEISESNIPESEMDKFRDRLNTAVRMLDFHIDKSACEKHGCRVCGADECLHDKVRG